jgi:transcriptional regulator with XRE-family HTH domain
MKNNFGETIRLARKINGYSQRDLCKKIGVDSGYISRIEKNDYEYPPKEEVIQKIALHLGLDEEELTFLAGRFPQRYKDFVKQNSRDVTVLFWRLDNHPGFAKQIFEMTKGGEL